MTVVSVMAFEIKVIEGATMSRVKLARRVAAAGPRFPVEPVMSLIELALSRNSTAPAAVHPVTVTVD